MAAVLPALLPAFTCRGSLSQSRLKQLETRFNGTTPHGRMLSNNGGLQFT
jgi:hypothetical protein